VAIVEESAGLRQRAIVDRWCYLGVAGPAARAAPVRFDIDVYNILVRPLQSGALCIEAL
jgi:excinuclease Cho